jgi:hypothetical protein
MSYFYLPRFKYQYVEWFVERGILSYTKANKMSLKSLSGKYREVRNKNG